MRIGLRTWNVGLKNGYFAFENRKKRKEENVWSMAKALTRLPMTEGLCQFVRIRNPV